MAENETNDPRQKTPKYDQATAAAAAQVARNYGRDLQNVFGGEVAEEIAQRIEALAT